MAAQQRAQREADAEWHSLRKELGRAQRDAAACRAAAAVADRRAAALSDDAARLRAKLGEVDEERDLLKRLLDGLLSDKDALSAECSALSSQVCACEQCKAEPASEHTPCQGVPPRLGSAWLQGSGIPHVLNSCMRPCKAACVHVFLLDALLRSESLALEGSLGGVPCGGGVTDSGATWCEFWHGVNLAGGRPGRGLPADARMAGGSH